jgi:hypothetical protein
VFFLVLAKSIGLKGVRENRLQNEIESRRDG